GESSAVRVLLGGKATITARERSVLTITEIPGTATVRLASGRAAIAVVKDKMKPGEIVEIRTPNAVVAVRGTVVIAEVEPVVGGYRSTITILKGHVDVTKLDGAGRLTGAAVDVRMLERVIVTNAKPLAAAEKITRRDAESLAAQFSFVPQTGPTASTEALTAQVKAAAINDAIQAVGGVVPDPRASVNASQLHEQHDDDEHDEWRDQHDDHRRWHRRHARDQHRIHRDDDSDQHRHHRCADRHLHFPAGRRTGDQPSREHGDQDAHQRDEPGGADRPEHGRPPLGSGTVRSSPGPRRAARPLPTRGAPYSTRAREECSPAAARSDGPARACSRPGSPRAPPPHRPGPHRRVAPAPSGRGSSRRP
ncbi:MAG: hypothetical protein DME05_16235, partial [Candidatus Rokuibacteriota bacterium]